MSAGDEHQSSPHLSVSMLTSVINQCTLPRGGRDALALNTGTTAQ